MKHDRSARRKFPYVNAIDALIVMVICTTVVVAYLRFSEPFRTPRPAGETAGELLQVELCTPSGSEWLVDESLDNLIDTDPRSGVADMRLSQAYRASDSSTRIQMELTVQRDSGGTIFFRNRPLVLGMKMQFKTNELVLEGWLCRIGTKSEAP